MRAVIQYVTRASVSVEGEVVGRIGPGCVILLGVGANDTEAEAQRLWNKIWHLRILKDEAGKTNLSLADVGGEVLIVSQFTLYADCSRGRRPSFAPAGRPEHAEPLYEHFIELARAEAPVVETGVFGAHMQVELSCDGPFTVELDTDSL